MSAAPSWIRSGPVLWVAAVVIGIGVGLIAFLIAPLPPLGAGPNGAPSDGSVSSPSSSAQPSAGKASTAAGEEDPAFTRAALLQPDELRHFGWGKADRTALYDGVSSDLPSLCASPSKVGTRAVEAYAAQYRGLQTRAVEIVVRHSSTGVAADRFEELADAIGDCRPAAQDREASPRQLHQPKLGGVQDVRWWQLKIPKGSVAPDKATRGTVALARVEDRLVYLLLTSPTSDPASTVQFEPLLTQAARRMV